MWPNDFEQWLPYAIETALQRIFNQLSRYPVLGPMRPNSGAGLLAERAVREAVKQARRRCRLPAHLVDRREFARWLAVLGWWEALTLAAEQPHVKQAFASLPPQQRRMLHWLYAAERLSLRDLQGLRQLSLPAVHMQAAAAFEAFAAALPSPPGQPPDESVYFPRPLALAGVR